MESSQYTHALYVVMAYSGECQKMVCLTQYSGSHLEVVNRIMSRARAEGFKGTLQERMEELQWWIVPAYVHSDDYENPYDPSKPKSTSRF